VTARAALRCLRNARLPAADCARTASLRALNSPRHHNYGIVAAITFSFFDIYRTTPRIDTAAAPSLYLHLDAYRVFALPASYLPCHTLAYHLFACLFTAPRCAFARGSPIPSPVAAFLLPHIHCLPPTPRSCAAFADATRASHCFDSHVRHVTGLYPSYFTTINAIHYTASYWLWEPRTILWTAKAGGRGAAGRAYRPATWRRRGRRRNYAVPTHTSHIAVTTIPYYYIPHTTSTCHILHASHLPHT